MLLIINGEERDFDAPLTIEQLLSRIGIECQKVAVERNLEIVPKSTYAGVGLNDGDKLEIVHFIGGSEQANFWCWWSNNTEKK